MNSLATLKKNKLGNESMPKIVYEGLGDPECHPWTYLSMREHLL